VQAAALVALSVLRFGLHLELGPEFDSNANRAEVFLTPPTVPPGDSPPPIPIESFLLRTTVAGTMLWSKGPNTLRLGLNGGGKVFFADAAQPQNVVVGQASLDDAVRAGNHLLLAVGGDYYDAWQWIACPDLVSGGVMVADTTCHRDFRAGSGRATLTVLAGPFDFSVGGGARDFQWKPDDGLSFEGYFGFASANAHFHTGGPETEADWDLSTSGRIERRDYHGPQLVANDDPGSPLEARRRDTDVIGNATVAYVGTLPKIGLQLLASAGYSIDYDHSTSFGESFLRHILLVKLAVPLPWKLTLAGKMQLIWTSYPQPVVLTSGMTPLQSIEDENRDAFVFDLERPIAGGLSISARYSLFINGTSSDVLSYQRQVAYLGLAYRLR
jgi:hypothetical protein